MAKERKQRRVEELAAQLAELRAHKTGIEARLQEIRDIRARAADPAAEDVDMAELRRLSVEQADVNDLLQVVEPRIRAIEAAQREAHEQERAAHALALRPKELQVIRRFEAWLADGVAVFDECRAMAAEIGYYPRCTPDATLERLVRYCHTETAAGRTVVAQYTDWAGRPVAAD